MRERGRVLVLRGHLTTRVLGEWAARYNQREIVAPASGIVRVCSTVFVGPRLCVFYFESNGQDALLIRPFERQC